MAGINRLTGRPLDGFAEVEQSIQVGLETPKRSRVIRRWFGSDIPRLVDRGVSQMSLVDFYMAIVEGIEFEPRFRMVKMALSTDSDIPNGNPIFDYEGIYYPRGHLGDFSVAETKQGRFVLADGGQAVRSAIQSV